MPMTKERIVELVREELRKHHPGGADLDIGPGPIRRQNDHWYVPVLPSREPPKAFEYYEALAEVEATLEEEEQLQVLLVPVTPEEIIPAQGASASSRATGE
jgi:hypothetical protein